MNETSSRSHAVFTLVLTQKRLDRSTNMVGEKVSRISLIDLAGSERANSTGATGTRLKEGALINKSLSTLGRVIAALAAASAAKNEKAAKAAAEKVPYRDSVGRDRSIRRSLSSALRTAIDERSQHTGPDLAAERLTRRQLEDGHDCCYLARRLRRDALDASLCVSLSQPHVEQLWSDCSRAPRSDQAKKIKNKAVVNEDPNAKLIRELKEELTLLRSRMAGPSALGNGGSPSLAGEATWDASIPPSQQLVQYQTASGELRTISKAELQDQLEASEKLMASVTETWEQKLEKTREVQVEREKALENLGITIEKNLVGVHAPKKVRYRRDLELLVATSSTLTTFRALICADASPRQPVGGSAHGRMPHVFVIPARRLLLATLIRLLPLDQIKPGRTTVRRQYPYPILIRG